MRGSLISWCLSGAAQASAQCSAVRLTVRNGAPDANKRDKQLLREHFEELEGESDEGGDEDADGGGSSEAGDSDEDAQPVRCVGCLRALVQMSSAWALGLYSQTRSWV